MIKGDGALERLAAGRVMLYDKTGTLTQGRPVLVDVVPAGDGVDPNELLRLAASLDQVSRHVLASAIVSAAAHRALPLEMPDHVVEEHGYGLRGWVGKHEVRLGKASWIVPGAHPAWMRQVRRRSDLDGSLTVFAAVDGEPAGAFLLEDLIRPDAPRMARGLREAGIERVVLVTGDRADIAATVGRIVGTDTVLAECDPAEKVAAIRAADVVLTVDRVDALADAILIAQRSRRIALQAVLVGMGLSLVAMVVASGGLLPPAAGAVLQEGIDVLAIGMALRAVLPGAVHSLAMEPADVALAQRLKAEHDATLGVVEQIRAVADTLSTQESVLAPVHALMVRLANELLPHERADEELMVPLVARALGTSATTWKRGRSAWCPPDA